MTGTETRARIDEQAARWAARRALADDSQAQDADFEAWLAADRRHQGAYLRAQAAYLALQDAAVANPVPVASNDDDVATAPFARRWARLSKPAWAAGLAVAACLVAAVLIRGPGLPGTPAETGREQLADGSSVVLGADSRISAAIDGAARRITLEQGTATFHVAKDRTRPFIVRSGKVYAEATGTVYSVRRVGSAGAAVRVSEGTVRVWAEAAPGEAVLLHAGQALTLDPAKPVAAAAGASPFWFDNISIDEAAARFNRVNATRIVVADRAIGRVTIVGGFRPDRPAEFARAAAALTGAQVTEREGTLVIGKK
ncbi:FecR family protein [Novosphingobium soli]|uniref:FecR domain-containing protein n=1 Tax=Novosphingobium soli TaxID=574956 RepID=A0ABV6CZC8_9SPHN